MRTSAWARSGARASTGRGPRPAGSWAASVARARAAWDGLTGGPSGSTLTGTGYAVGSVRYSDAAAAAILSTALGLWADTSAALGGDDGDGLEDTAPGGTD
jgi:hypothetical protein